MYINCLQNTINDRRHTICNMQHTPFHMSFTRDRGGFLSTPALPAGVVCTVRSAGPPAVASGCLGGARARLSPPGRVGGRSPRRGRRRGRRPTPWRGSSWGGGLPAPPAAVGSRLTGRRIALGALRPAWLRLLAGAARRAAVTDGSGRTALLHHLAVL